MKTNDLITYALAKINGNAAYKKPAATEFKLVNGGKLNGLISGLEITLNTGKVVASVTFETYNGESDSAVTYRSILADSEIESLEDIPL